MWVGELITERGIGNGISFIIFAGIVSQAPSAIGAFIVNPNIAALIAFGIVAIAAVAVIIYIQEGQRRIPVQYASRVRGRRMYQGGQTFLPLRVNQAGVIPIIFAVSILLFPVQLASYFTASEIEHRRGHRRRDRLPVQPELGLLHRPVLPADGRLHVLLHGLHVQTGRDRRAAAQERRLHPGHPAGPSDPGLPCPGRVAASRSPARCSWRSWPCRRSIVGSGLPGPRRDRPRRHEPADRRVGRRRDDEADRGAADDAQLRGLHPLSARRRRSGRCHSASLALARRGRR